MGLPGAGKPTWERLVPYLNAVWLNADKVREAANDWDFSTEGRLRQAKRMKDLAQKALDNGKYGSRFVARQLKQEDFNADIVIWLDTIKEEGLMILIKYLLSRINLILELLEKMVRFGQLKLLMR